MNHLALFNGIGGFQLAASWVGWNNVAHVEIDSFCNKVVAYHFPESQCFTDIKQFNGKPFRNTIDIISGGFPCQPYSAAGKRLGTADDRHLWPSMRRVISEIQPSWVVGENVRGLTNWNGGLVFDQVQADLEAEGYEVLPFLLPACAVNAPHRRDRIWFIAHSGTWDARKGDAPTQGGGKFVIERGEAESSGIIGRQIVLSRIKETRRKGGGIIQKECITPHTDGLRRKQEYELQQSKLSIKLCKERNATDSGSQGRERSKQHGTHGGKERECGEPHKSTPELHQIPNWSNFPTQSPICDRNDGLSGRLVGITFPKWRNESIKALGNSIVPQVAFEIFKAIQQYNRP
jgi:DNA (cytosine-5)-methyltransferase 1